MTITVKCEECDTALTVKLDSGYAEGRCVYCGQDIEVEFDGAELVSAYGCAL